MYLNCHTNFSFLYGTLSPKELLQKANALRLEKFVLSDINNTSACIEMARLVDKQRKQKTISAAEKDLEPIYGIDFRNGAQQCFVGIARNHQGFERLNRLLSHYLHQEKKMNIPKICPPLKDVFVVYPFSKDLLQQPLSDHEFIGVSAKNLPFLKSEKWKPLYPKMVILHPVTLKNTSDFRLHQLLRCIGENTILSKLPECCQEDEYFLEEEPFWETYREFEFLFTQTQFLLDNCETIDFELGINKNKSIISKTANSADALEADFQNLKKLTLEGAQKRYGTLDQVVQERIEKELSLIQSRSFVSYFLINHCIITFAKEKGFYYIGRGSGANSVVAYCLQITDVDPMLLDLYFERFINEFRQTPPDFDIDFSWADRDEVIQFIFDTFGYEHTCLQATYTTFQSNSVIRELGKVYGLPTAEIEQLAASFKNGTTGTGPLEQELIRNAKNLLDFPRNLSIHAGGILISAKPIYAYTATSLPPKGYPICQFDMHSAEDLGLYKFDILSQRGLGHIKDTLQIVKENQGVTIDIHDIPAFMADPAIVRHLEKGDLIGCFYVESPAMRMLLAKLECKDYPTLVAASSIIRPGVAQSGMMREYVRRHHLPDKGQSECNPVLWNLMKDTYGVMVYQEDVIKVAHRFAGLNPAESDVLRRGMSGKYRSREEFQRVKDRFFENCLTLGHPEVLSREIWRQIESFAGYSFAKGHSASFAVESYQSMYLKAHFPLEFMVGVINNFGGFYRTEFYVQEAQKDGATVEAPCVNNSYSLTTIRLTNIYLGLGLVKSLETKIVQQIEVERQRNGPFTSLLDFTERISISLEQLIIIIRIQAFRFTGKSKQALLWDAHFINNKKKPATLPSSLFKNSGTAAPYKIPDLHHDFRNDMLDELELLGFTIQPPFVLINKNDIPEGINLIKAVEIPQHVNKEICIIGHLVTTKHSKTRNGDSMYFGTFLDEERNWIDTVIFPQVAAQNPFRGMGCYLIKGKVTEEFNFFTIEVVRMKKLGWWNASL